MASLVLLRNPLAPHTREQFALPDGMLVIDWLQEHYPDGFGMPIRFQLNGKEMDLDDLDTPLGADDVAVIAMMPAAGASLLTMILLSAAMSLVTSFVMRAFMPKVGGPKQKGEVQTFNISSNQNGARVGEAIPVVYGSVIMTPDYVSEPYTWYFWDQTQVGPSYGGVQYLDLLLCVGQGNVDVSKVFIGDTDSKTLDAGIVTWRAFKPAEHKKTPGVIAAAMGAGFHENVMTASEVSSQEFTSNSDTAGFFAVCRPGQKGNKLQFDIIFPNGQTNPNGKGDIEGRTTEFNIIYREINDADAAITSDTVVNIICSTEKDHLITAPLINSGTTRIPDAPVTNRTRISSPIRKTFTLNMPRAARWAVKIARTSEAPNKNQGTDRFIWSGLRCFLTYPSAPIYGDVTLLAVRIKASNGIGADAAVRIRAKVTRRLQPPAGGAEAASMNGADAFADIYTNAVYGAARPRSELDVATLNSLRAKWAGGGYQFNHVFVNQDTVWEALRTVTTPFGAEPLPIGQMMSVAQDGVKTIRSALFTDANIVDNTMSIDYSFDEPGAPDGVEFEYINPVDFRPAFTRYPTTALRIQKYQLPGVTNATHAAQYARLTWQRNIYQRERVTFETELEGLILTLGDRIGIAHNVPKWGDSGLVVGVTGNILQVDHDLDWAGGGRYIMLRKTDGSVTSPIAVSRGGSDDKVQLPSAPPFTPNIENAYDFTSFAFGTASSIVRDFIVVAVRPTQDNTVSIEAVKYNPSVFTGAMTYMD